MSTFLPGTDSILALPLERARSLDSLPNGVIVMRPLNEAHLATILEMETDQLPPIEVVLMQEGFLVIDGYHRLERAKRKGEPTIRCHTGTYTSEYQVMYAAFQANMQHGLPANSITRTAFALWLYLTPDELGNTLSMRAAAKKAGISEQAVSKAYKKLQESGELEGKIMVGVTRTTGDSTRRLGKVLLTFIQEDVRLDMSQGLLQYLKKHTDKTPQTIARLRFVAQAIATAAEAMEQQR